MRRTVIYVPIELLRRLKAKLALEGKSVSEWFRKKAEQYLDEE